MYTKLSLGLIELNFGPLYHVNFTIFREVLCGKKFWSCFLRMLVLFFFRLPYQIHSSLLLG